MHRSSLLTQIISAAGHTQLDQLIGASKSNPHGFCEGIRINRLNDDVPAAMTPTLNSTVASLWSATFESVLSWATSRTYLVDTADLAPVLPGLSSVIGTTLTTDAVDRRVAHDRRRLRGAESAALRTIDS